MEPSELESKVQEQVVDFDLTPKVYNSSIKVNGENLEHVYRVEMVTDWRREKTLMRIYFYRNEKTETRGLLELDVTGNVRVKII